MKKNIGKMLIGFCVGVILSFITIVAIAVVLLLLFFYGGPPEIERDISKYEEMISKSYELKSGLITFPEKIPESAREVDYYFSYQDTWNTPTVEVFLQCTYDEEDYHTEIQRLEHTKKKYVSGIETLIKDEDGRYPYPAYIAIDGFASSYEYALLSGERQITYIYTKNKILRNLKKVEEKYLPVQFDWRIDELDNAEKYSIYMDAGFIVDGELKGWSYNNTRDAAVDVLKYHPVEVGYNLVGVCTKLDEQGTELIQYCYYMYYDSEHDSMCGLPEEIPFEELEGYEYRGISLREDEKCFEVLYYDGTEEKTMEYEIPKV